MPPLSPVGLASLNLALEFEDACAKLLGAQHALHAVADEVANAKQRLEEAKAHKLAAGIEGKNAEQREANLYLCLQSLHRSLLEKEQQLSTAKLEHDMARVEWDCLRYRLRSYEAATRCSNTARGVGHE